MEMRQVAAEVPEMLLIRDGMSGLWEAVQVEQRGCESWEDDGQVVRWE
jgi:hypothetical protein